MMPDVMNAIDGFEELFLGRVFARIEGAEVGSERVVFADEHGTEISMWHSPDCCESVDVNEIHGDIADLIGEPLLRAQASSSGSQAAEADYGDTSTWTFYKFATIKGEVVIRWLGSSNGYYSEEVAFGITKAGPHDLMKHAMGVLDLPASLTSDGN